MAPMEPSISYTILYYTILYYDKMQFWLNGFGSQTFIDKNKIIYFLSLTINLSKKTFDPNIINAKIKFDCQNII